jgi:hypothetical protein
MHIALPRRLIVVFRRPVRAKAVREAFLALPTVEEEEARVSLARVYYGPGGSGFYPGFIPFGKSVHSPLGSGG